MDEITILFGSLTRLLVVIAGGLSPFCACWAGILWMTSGGDPQNVSRARMAFVGAVCGLVIVGVAFIIPRVIGETVVEPVGGYIRGVDADVSCDDLLRSQLVFQRNASSPDAFQSIVSAIQNQRFDQCSADVWNPRVGTLQEVGGRSPSAGCQGNEVGSQVVPFGLRQGGGVDPQRVRYNSGRDRGNNILVHWLHDRPPADEARCWLYVAEAKAWSAGR